MSDYRNGEVPTTGTSRSGPLGWPLQPRTVVGVRPIAMRIPSIQVDTEIERRPVIDGVMADPTGPFVVAWYGVTGKLGVVGNVVLAGHVDYAGVGPAVFARIDELQPGDLIELTGENISLFQYEVAWSELFSADSAPVSELAGKTEQECVTIITCGGDFDRPSGQYTHRLVVRGERMP